MAVNAPESEGTAPPLCGLLTFCTCKSCCIGSEVACRVPLNIDVCEGDMAVRSPRTRGRLQPYHQGNMC